MGEGKDMELGGWGNGFGRSCGEKSGGEYGRNTLHA